MKTALTTFGFALVVTLSAGGLALSDDKGAKAKEGMADKPGPVHEALARRAGDYDTVSRFTPSAGATPVESKGTAKITPAVDGRFLLEESTGTLFGQPVKALRLLGYNSRTKQYEATWTYSMATGMMSMTGTSSDGGKTIEWTEINPTGRGAASPLHITTRYIDDDKFVTEMTMRAADGKVGPTLEAIYTRKK
jgi:hypothetical protein